MKVKIESIADDAKFELRKSIGYLRVSVSFVGETLSATAPLTIFGKMGPDNVPRIIAMLPKMELDVGMEFESISRFEAIKPAEDAIKQAPNGRDVEVVGRFTAHMDGEHASIYCRDLEIIVSVAEELPEFAMKMAPNTWVSFMGHDFSLYWRPQ